MAAILSSGNKLKSLLAIGDFLNHWLALSRLAMGSWWFRKPAKARKCLSSILFVTRARLRRVATIGRPRSVYKNNVECSFLSRNDGQMALMIKVNDLHLQ